MSNLLWQSREMKIICFGFLQRVGRLRFSVQFLGKPYIIR
jgi:hypothetical protein